LDKDDHSKPAIELDAQDLSADEDEIDRHAAFEQEYNFRFEEEEQREFLMRYPKKIPSSLRRENDKRKAQRERKKARKGEKNLKKANELQRKKAEKRKEIINRLRELQQSGNTNITEDILDEEFDAEKHETLMKQLFGENEFQEFRYEDDEEEDSEEKGDWINKVRKSKDSKATFNPDSQSFGDFLDEYYQLDYEDLIDDIPCRFKYRNVEPTDYGLTTDEILYSEDAELNKWYSVRKATQFKTEEEEKADIEKYNQKKSMKKKERILYSFYHKDEIEQPNNESLARTRSGTKKGKKNQMKGNTAEGNDGSVEDRLKSIATGGNETKKKRKRSAEVSDARMKAYGVNLSQQKRKDYWQQVKKSKNAK